MGSNGSIIIIELIIAEGNLHTVNRTFVFKEAKTREDYNVMTNLTVRICDDFI